MAALCAAGALHAAARLRGTPAARSWALIGLSQAVSTAGELVWRATGQPEVSVADAFYLGAYPLLFAGVGLVAVSVGIQLITV